MTQNNKLCTSFKTKYFMAALAAIITLSGCSSNPSGGQVAFETFTVDKSVSAGDESSAPKCSVHLEVAMAKGDSASSAKTINDALAHELFYIDGLTLEQAADSFARKYTDDYRKNIVPLYREDRDDELKRAWYEYYYNISSEATGGRDGVTVYKAVVDYYEGGAHGINQELYFNFDAATGRQLMLSDLFVPGFEQPLSQLLLKSLMDQTGTESVD